MRGPEAEIIKTGCKINLFLHITGVLPSGLHTLESFFIPLAEPFDELVVSPSDGKGFTFVCADPEIDPLNNTLSKAYARYAQAGGFAPALRLELRKGVPKGAGLGGGSANAAGLLLCLNRLNGGALGVAELEELAAGVGADVPFFIRNRPALVQGIGELVEPRPNPFAGFYLALACPGLSVSTAWAYASWDKALHSGEAAFSGSKTLELEATRLTDSSWRDSRSGSCGPRLYNSLESVTFAAFPVLREIKGELLNNGACGALMSGSGSGVFGLFKTRARAEKAALRLRERQVRVFVHQIQ